MSHFSHSSEFLLMRDACQKFFKTWGIPDEPWFNASLTYNGIAEITIYRKAELTVYRQYEPELILLLENALGPNRVKHIDIEFGDLIESVEARNIRWNKNLNLN